MRFFSTLLLCSILGITSPALAQKASTPSEAAHEFWLEFSLKDRSQTDGVPSGKLSSVEDIALKLSAVKRQNQSSSARFSPTWCYSEGNFAKLEDGERTYFRERYSYTTTSQYSIELHQVTSNGQFIAESQKGTATISAEDTLVIQMQEMVDGTWKNLSYYKGFYDNEALMFRPVLMRDYERSEEDGETSESVLSYRYFYNHPQQLAYEITSDTDFLTNGVTSYHGIRIRRYQNGSYVSARSGRRGVWEDDEKLEVTQTNNRKESNLFYSMGANQWVPISRIINLYNDQGQETEQIMQENIGTGDMINVARFVSTYQNGRLTTYEYFMADSEDPSIWNLQERTAHTYTTAGQLESSETSRIYFVGRPLEPVSKTTFTYYPAGGSNARKLQTETEHDYDGVSAWLPKNRTTYTYTLDEAYTSTLEEENVNGQWQRTNAQTFELDSNHLLVAESVMAYTDGVEDFFDVRTYTYARCETVLSAEDDLAQAQQKKINAYPNPFTDHLTLQVTLPKSTDVQVSIVSQVGQVLKTYPTRKLGQGTQEIALALENLPAGVYLCRIQSADGVQTTRVIKR